MFGADIEHIDADSTEVKLHTETETRIVPADLLIGADGAFSTVRERLRDTGRIRSSLETISHAYIELTVRPAADGGFRMDPRALHIWPRGSFMMIALPNPDGSFTCTLFLARDGGDDSFAALASPQAGAMFLAHEFPDLAALLDDPQRQWTEHVPSGLHYVRCAPYACGRAVLIGDAAHAVVPFFGQGMNAAFEDCRLLFAAMGPSVTSWPDACARWALARGPDGDAISELALANFHEMRAHVADARFLERKDLEHVLSDHFPESYRSRYELVTYTDVPYAEARRLSEQHDALLSDDAVRLGLLVLAFCRWLGRPPE